MKFHAHSTDDPSKANWQSLAEHLVAVAEIARVADDKLDAGRPAARAGSCATPASISLQAQRRWEGSAAGMSGLRLDCTRGVA